MPSKEEAIQILGSMPPEVLVSSLLLERVPFIFEENWNDLRKWRGSLASMIDVDPCDIFFTGSSATGSSLNPYKNFRGFHDGSDIDLAIISDHHFDIAWRFIRSQRRRKISDQFWNIIQDHKANHIYWGCIACEAILPDLPFGSTWLSAFQKMSEHEITKDRTIRSRIYRDVSSLRSYQANNIRGLKASIK